MPQFVFGHKQWKRFEGNYESQFRILGGEIDTQPIEIDTQRFQTQLFHTQLFHTQPFDTQPFYAEYHET